ESDLPTLIRRAAEGSILLIDPNLMASFWFFKEQRSKSFENALQAVKTCLAHTDVIEHKRAYVAWGNILRAQRNFDEAFTKYRLAVELDPGYASAYNSWGILLRQRRRFSEALEMYSKAISLDRKHAFAYHNMGLVYGEQRDLDQAIKSLTKAIELNPR